MALDRKTKEQIRQERLEREEEELRASTGELLSNPQFQRFLWWLLGQCEIYGTDISANSSMYIAAGQRNVGLKILAHLNAVDPRAYARLMLARADEADAIRATEGDDAKHVTEERIDV